MSVPLDIADCLKQAKAYADMANATTNAELRSAYLELASHYTELAAAIQGSPALHSELQKLRNGGGR